MLKMSPHLRLLQWILKIGESSQMILTMMMTVKKMQNRLSIHPTNLKKIQFKPQMKMFHLKKRKRNKKLVNRQKSKMRQVQFLVSKTLLSMTLRAPNFRLFKPMIIFPHTLVIEVKLMLANWLLIWKMLRTKRD